MEATDPLGSIERIWRYPVKSLAPNSLESARLDARGIEGDRGSALFLETRDRGRSGKTFRGKEHNLLHTLTTVEEATSVVASAGLSVAERRDGPYFDLSPISIVFDRWIDELEALLGMSLDPQRFRPNFFVRAEAGFALREGDLVGSLLAAGEVRLRVTAETERCVTPSYDVETGFSEPRVLRVLAQQRDNVCGIYCEVERGGTVRLGDALERLQPA